MDGDHQLYSPTLSVTIAWPSDHHHQHHHCKAWLVSSNHKSMGHLPGNKLRLQVEQKDQLQEEEFLHWSAFATKVPPRRGNQPNSFSLLRNSFSLNSQTQYLLLLLLPLLILWGESLFSILNSFWISFHLVSLPPPPLFAHSGGFSH